MNNQHIEEGWWMAKFHQFWGDDLPEAVRVMPSGDVFTCGFDRPSSISKFSFLYRINPPVDGYYSAYYKGAYRVTVRLQEGGTKVMYNDTLYDSVEFTLIERVTVNNQ